MSAASNYSIGSTDAQAGPNGERRPVGETLGDVDPRLDKVLDMETVRPWIAALPERQRTILTLRFFENMSQTEIAEHIGSSQMHVSRYSPGHSTRCAAKFAQPISPRRGDSRFGRLRRYRSDRAHIRLSV